MSGRPAAGNLHTSNDRGTEDVSQGEICMDGKVINKVQPCDRNMAMVFQNYALYPHMTVLDNMAYSLKINGVPKKERRKKVEEAAKILGLTQVLDRKPGELSGGQKQRVAIGRAIVRNPRVFLMDEPLSNLDAKLRTDEGRNLKAVSGNGCHLYLCDPRSDRGYDSGNKDCGIKRRGDSAGGFSERTV